MLACVLIEIEGVLVDTAPARRAALIRALRDDGVDIAPAAAYGRGGAREDVAAVAAALGAPLDATALELAALRAQRYFADVLASGLSLTSGARDAVERIAAHAPVAVVTRADRREAELLLGLTGLEHAIAFAVTAEDAVPKPSPASYRLALQRLGRRAPLRGVAVALEDAPAGIRAATAAGLRCIAVGSPSAHETMTAAAIVPSLAGLTAGRLERAAGMVAAVVA